MNMVPYNSINLARTFVLSRSGKRERGQKTVLHENSLGCTQITTLLGVLACSYLQYHRVKGQHVQNTTMALLVVLAQGSAQFNSSCVQVLNSTAAGVSPYPADEPSLAFTMEGVTNLKTNNVSSWENRQLVGVGRNGYWRSPTHRPNTKRVYFQSGYCTRNGFVHVRGYSSNTKYRSTKVKPDTIDGHPL